MGYVCKYSIDNNVTTTPPPQSRLHQSKPEAPKQQKQNFLYKYL